MRRHLRFIGLMAWTASRLVMWRSSNSSESPLLVEINFVNTTAYPRDVAGEAKVILIRFGLRLSRSRR